MRKIVSSVMLSLILLSSLTMAFNIKPASGEWTGTVYIRADGSIDPPTAPIQRDGNLYTFTDNIYGSIVVQRGNIIINGSGYSLYGSGSGSGISLSDINNVTVTKVHVKGFYSGIYLQNSSNNNIFGNDITNCRDGIGIQYSTGRGESSNNKISENNITSNKFGIWLGFPTSTNILRNNITANNVGILFWFSGGIIENNVISNNGLGIYSVSGGSKILNNTIDSNSYGIYSTARGGEWVTNWIENNDIINNSNSGIYLFNQYGTCVLNNKISSNTYGIYFPDLSYEPPLWEVSRNNLIKTNDILYNHYGIYLGNVACNTKVYHNNLINNTNQAYDNGTDNSFDDGYPSGGNYWSDYTGIDEKSGPNQDQPGCDGIGDTPYVIDENSMDRYPLMKPWSLVQEWSFDSDFQYNLDDDYGTVEGFGHIRGTATLSGSDILIQGEVSIYGQVPSHVPTVYLIATDGIDREYARQIVDLSQFTYSQTAPNTYTFKGKILNAIKPVNNGHYEVEAHITYNSQQYEFFINTNSRISSHYLPLTTLPPENRPPNPPTLLWQAEVKLFDTETWLTDLPVGGTIYGDTVAFLGEVSDPDGDRVRMQVELRRLGEYGGNFIGVPTHESELVDSDGGAIIIVYGLVAGSYHWQARTIDEHGLASEWVDFGNNEVSETDFAVATEIVFRPPYRLSSMSGWSESHLLGEASYYSEVDPSAGDGKIIARAKVTYGGDGKALAAFTLGDYWTNEWSGTANIVATFNITGLITWASFFFPVIAEAQVFVGVTLKASLWVYDHSTSTAIWHKDLIIYNKEPEWKVISVPEADSVRYSDTQYVIQGFIDLQKDHTYSWYFEARIWTWVIVAGFATAVAGGNITPELIDVRIGPLVKPEPEPIVAVENVMYVAVGSPVDVLVVDPEGRRIGFDFVSQQEVNEIPEAWFSGRRTYPQLIIIPAPVAGNYKLLTFGTDTDTYTMFTFTHFATQEIVSFRAIDIPTSANATHQYTIDWDALSAGGEGVTVQVDSDGDGIFEHTFTSDNELTHDEFVLQTETLVNFDPDTLNLGSKGEWITAYIELPEGFDVADINVSTILLNNTVPVDVNAPITLGDYDNDSIPDLMVKFNRAEVASYILANVNMRELIEKRSITITLTITGRLNDGTPFQGTNTIRIIYITPRISRFKQFL